MKFATFDKQITELKKFYDEACARDTKIQEALGGGTQVMTDWWSSILNGMLDAIKSEFDLPKNDDTIDWLFYDCICNDEEMTFECHGINYIGNTKNVYLSLTGMLDERLGETPLSSEELEVSEVPKASKDTNSDIFNKIKRYFEAAGVTVKEYTNEDSTKNIIKKLLKTDDLYKDIKQICYDEQLFKVCILDVSPYYNYYEVKLIKAKEGIPEIYDDPKQALENKG